MDPQRLRCGRRRGRNRRARGEGRFGTVWSFRARPRVADRRQPLRRPARHRGTRRADDARAGRRTTPDPLRRRPRRDRLHLRHDRPAEGLHAQPRQHRRQRPQLHAERRLQPGIQFPRLDAAVPAARAQLRPAHPVRRHLLAHRPRAGRHGRRGRRTAGVPADGGAVGAAAVGKGLQQRPAQGRRRGSQHDLRPGGGHRHRLQPGAGHRRSRPRAPAEARAVRPPRLRQAARGARRPGAVLLERGRAARPAARALLPRLRHHHPGRLRPDRDQPRDQLQHPRRAQDRHRRPADPRLHDPDRAGRRGPRPGATWSSRVTGTTTSPPRR